ncbi:unnamed protein product [Aphanomyces euteiches]|uniref:Uncharacterized protein n=1 Tax=Aphanomyces euteiches TaxID=100861 RepID=A0A6G0X075_9STRA|nr:hypothetical protein Ae201684_009830 [Aphanomyces euteiches]KAH9095936.1 hypothetical protein Ae201684P_010145 [Aphanomyces euteiches]KAH9106704.1 hypothetical protein AeMF1_017763 [Aphanomyces euteiches]KAH9109748.1 hypothetical protein LEN26_013953 [Aphanomyces euteiches]KAH9143675.1 hypothetical protein AeRB84_012351 [Aphanomyces euteiches]
MGNQTSLSFAEFPLASQLHNPVVLISDSFVSKTSTTLTYQGHDLIARGKSELTMRGVKDNALSNRRLEYIDKRSNQAVANMKANVVFAGNSTERPRAMVKPHPINRTIEIVLAGHKRLLLRANTTQAVLLLENSIHGYIPVAHFTRNDSWSVTIAAGVDTTLGAVAMTSLIDMLRWSPPNLSPRHFCSVNRAASI